jgi:hypothetical protein
VNIKKLKKETNNPVNQWANELNRVLRRSAND